MTASIRTLVVDDELIATKRLSLMLAAHPQVEVVGQAEDIETAHQLYLSKRPNLLFLDIQLLQRSRFEFVPMLNKAPVVVFIMANHAFAARAFEVFAEDYLMKPIQANRLADALMRAEFPENEPETPSHDGYVAYTEDHMHRRIQVETISHIEALDNYTLLHMTDGPSKLIRRTMTDWQKQLPENDFLRVGRSLIIRIGAIQILETESRDISLLTLVGTIAPIRIGRRAGLSLRRALGK